MTAYRLLRRFARDSASPSSVRFLLDRDLHRRLVAWRRVPMAEVQAPAALIPSAVLTGEGDRG